MQTQMFPEVSGKFLIAGEWHQGKQLIDVHNPADTSEIVGQAAMCSEDEVKAAIEAADKAFQTWSKTTPEERAEKVLRAVEILRPLVNQHIPLFVRENGKVMVEAKKDIVRCIDVLANGAQVVKKWWQPVMLAGQQKVQIRRRPRGVAAIISPWNSPMILTFKRFVPAILAGNTVVIKPATYCPLTIMSFIKAIEPVFPPGVINIVTGSGSKIGEILSTDPRIRTISFIGGTETGKEIMAKASSTLKRLTMELGGNDPALVLKDANLDSTSIERIKGGILRATGQVCSAIKRIYVHESKYEELLDKLSRAFQKTVVGNGLLPDATMGPLNNQAQFNFVQKLIEKTKQQGATVSTFGKRLDPESWDRGYFMLPSIVTDVEHAAELVQCEQFGPVIPVIPFKDEEEAIAMANDTEFGLRASVWTQDEEKAKQIADRLQAGAVFHNNHTIFQDLNLDFPGVKQSAHSRETLWAGLEFFSDSYGFAD